MCYEWGFVTMYVGSIATNPKIYFVLLCAWFLQLFSCTIESMLFSRMVLPHHALFCFNLCSVFFLGH